VNTFEYVSVIFSVVVSLAFTHLLAGMVRLIHARGVKFSFVHAGWIALLVFWCVDYWFSVWHLRDAETWTLGFVSFLLLMATVLYIACGLAVPTESELTDSQDLQGVLRRQSPPISRRSLHLPTAQHLRKSSDRPAATGRLGQCRAAVADRRGVALA